MLLFSSPPQSECTAKWLFMWCHPLESLTVVSKICHVGSLSVFQYNFCIVKMCNIQVCGNGYQHGPVLKTDRKVYMGVNKLFQVFPMFWNSLVPLQFISEATHSNLQYETDPSIFESKPSNWQQIDPNISVGPWSIQSSSWLTGATFSWRGPWVNFLWFHPWGWNY